MKLIPLVALGILCSLASGYAQATDASATFDENLTFDDNLVPPGWAITFPYGGPGRNAHVANQRFEIGAVDTYAALEKNKRLPAGFSQVHISYTCDVKNVNPGMGYQIHLIMRDGTDFFAGFGKVGFGMKEMAAYGGHYDTIEFYQTYSPQYGTYILDVTFGNDQIVLTATRVKNGKIFASATVPVAGLDARQLRTVRLFGIMTTGHDPSPAWIDDALIEALP